MIVSPSAASPAHDQGDPLVAPNKLISMDIVAC